jgi:hypothetical protein
MRRGRISDFADIERAVLTGTQLLWLAADLTPSPASGGGQGGGSFISIQRELRGNEAAQLAAHPRLTQIGGELADFDDTAAVLALCDLLVTVDTAPAHLAGAMGRPVWVLVPFAPDWRWTLEGETTPWYPNMRIFRQAALGDWSVVIARVAAALHNELPRLR